jgi:hypothetical protein
LHFELEVVVIPGGKWLFKPLVIGEVVGDGISDKVCQ